MMRDRRWILVAAMASLLLLPACRDTGSETTEGPEPVTVEPIEGTDLSRVTLTARAAERLGIETAMVTSSADRTAVPAAAVWIDANGEAWVYATSESLVFVREGVVVGRFDGDVAVLTDGPPIGTEVVTVGVAELIGSEFGV